MKRDDTIPVLPIALGALALVAGVVLLLVVGSSSKSTTSIPSVPPFSSTLSNENLKNRWIRVEGVEGKTLGVSDDALPASVRGFRPSRQVSAPTTPFEIQQHEVTWEEFDPWIVKNLAFAFPRPLNLPGLVDALKPLPVQGIPWSTAREYCRSIGATLPTEEQWELAARGVTLNKFPLGNELPNWSQVHAFKGPQVVPAPFMSNLQDVTSGPPNKAIYDLLGNVQEWTSSVWRDDLPGKDESWTASSDTTAYVIRGLPLHRAFPGRPDELNLAYRDWACAQGDCSPLSSGASAKERARTPKLEWWAGADSTKPGAAEWRRVIEASDVESSMTKCFSSPTSAQITISVAKESFCRRPEHAPAGGKCGEEPAFMGTLARVSSGLSEPVLTCVNYQLHKVSATQVANNLPEVRFSYALYVTTNPMEPIGHIGFRCAREVPSP